MNKSCKKVNGFKDFCKRSIPEKWQHAVKWILHFMIEIPDKISFSLNFHDKKYLYGTLDKCDTLDSYFEFSQKVFKITQVKTEIVSFLEYAMKREPRCVCEIGTENGGNCFLLGQALPNISLVMGRDLYVHNKHRLHYLSKPGQGIILIDGSSYDSIIVAKAEKILSGRKIDLLFIDGDHSYDGVKKDFLSYRHLVSENGIIAFHDITKDYFTKFEIETKAYSGGVPDFYKLIKSFYPSIEFVNNPDQDGCGIGAIVYSEKVAIPKDL